MKTKIYLLLMTFLTVNFAVAQSLFTEDFDNLTVGDLGTSITRQTPGQNGWYTYGSVNTGNNFVANADFQIVPETGRGNVLTIEPPNTGYAIAVTREVYRTDIETIWNQRAAGNDIFKLSFDVYTGGVVYAEDWTRIDNFILIWGKQKLLVNLYLDMKNKALSINPSNQLSPSRFGPFITYLPIDSWVTIELFIDYTADKFYVRVPSQNLSYAFDSLNPLSLINYPGANDEPLVDDTPIGVRLQVRGGPFLANLEKVRYDNINISAVNTAPTVSVNKFISGKFNVFPNPVENIVTITNSENIGIEKVTVFDMTGKTVKMQNYENEKEVTLDIAGFTSGVYLFHIKTREGTIVKKVVKQ